MTGFIVSVFSFRNRVSSTEAFEGLELGEGKPSRPVLRGPGGRKAAWLLGSNPVGHRADKSRKACNWRLPDRMQRNADREMMLGAGRMTATARADIGARCSSPTVKRGSEVCVQTCDDARQL